MPDSGSVLRSFRLSANTAELLDAAAAQSGDSRTSLVERLLAESLRTDRHPLIRFHSGAAGRREPWVVGTRLRVREVATMLHDNRGDVAEVAALLEVSPVLIRAAASYYSEFQHEVDADIEWAQRIADDELGRWQREQTVFA